MSSAQYILRTHQLRHTASRADILDMFRLHQGALSEPEIERGMKDNCDRVTIYRTLNTFLEKGIIHKVLDDAGAMKYALCAADCEHEGMHNHDHVHFKCEKCGLTNCLDHARMPDISLPTGYQIHEVNVLIQGICPECRARQ